MPVYLAATAKARLEQLAAAAGITLTEWVLDAFDEEAEVLGAQFAPAAARRSGLPPRTRVTRPRAEASSSVQLRLTDDELTVIDQAVTHLGVPSRSALLEKAITLRIAREPTP